jgi:hypothetical protein
MATKLKVLDMTISEGFLVYFIMTSLLTHYTPFKVSYNTQNGKWNILELISYCVEEEERQKSEKKTQLTLLLQARVRIKLSLVEVDSLERSSSQITKMRIIIMIRILVRTMVRIMVIRTMLRTVALKLVISVARLIASRSTIQASRNGAVRMV